MRSNQEVDWRYGNLIAFATVGDRVDGETKM